MRLAFGPVILLFFHFPLHSKDSSFSNFIFFRFVREIPRSSAVFLVLLNFLVFSYVFITNFILIYMWSVPVNKLLITLHFASSSCGAYPVRILVTTVATRTLSALGLKKPTVVVLNHILKFLSDDILLLPGPRFLLIFSWKINCSNSYRWRFLITSPKYSSVRAFIVKIISLDFSILSRTLLISDMICSGIFKIRGYTQISYASSVLH